MVKICICGGGSTGHVCAGFFSAQEGVVVNIFTKHPSKWGKNLKVTDNDGKCYQGDLNIVSSDAAEAVAGCDVILLCVPGFLIEGILSEICPFVGNSFVGSIVSSTGFFTFAHNILPIGTALFGFQRTPFIARVEQYGSTANLLGYKKELFVAMENIKDSESFRKRLELLFKTPVSLLGSIYEASLTNSNPILHTGRLYSMFAGKEREPSNHCILFYKEWDDASSQVLIDMDYEFISLVHKLLGENCSISPLLDYYESSDAASLSMKISSIPAFQAITAPMVQEEDGLWYPDFSNRYFTEDFSFGLRFIRDLCHINEVPCPMIDKVYSWGVRMVGT